MMFHSTAQKSSFILILQQIDIDAANEAQQVPCQHCGGKLHQANYLRKSRGLEETADPHLFLRYSLCCSVDGCRKRYLPNSVRFFGRCVYLFFWMVLTSSVQDKTISELAKQMGVSRQTIKRWHYYWQAVFPQTGAWKTIRAMFAIAPAVATLPSSLLKILGFDHYNLESLIKSLKIISGFL